MEQRLEKVEKTQQQMLELLQRMSQGGGADLSPALEAEINEAVGEIRSVLQGKSPQEAKAILAAVRAAARGEAVGGGSTNEEVVTDRAAVFASYSPAEVVKFFARLDKPLPLTEPVQEDFVAAVGFVDVSGFTKLSEKLAVEHGRNGSELLNVYINGG